MDNNTTTQETKEINTMTEAVDQAFKDFPSDWETSLDGSQEQPVVDKPETSEPAPKPSEESKPASQEEKPEAKKEEESSLPEDLKTPSGDVPETDLKRIKGFQASYTKRMQELAAKEKELETNLRSEYEQKFKEVVGRISPQSPSNQSKQTQSLRDFFPEADPNSLNSLEQAFNTLIEQRVKPLQEENKRLAQYVTTFDANTRLVSEWATVKEKYRESPVPPKDDLLPDLIAFKHNNPTLCQGLSVEGIYRQWAFEKLPSVAQTKVMEEMKKKEKESVESDNSTNTVENFEVKNLRDAVRLAEKELSQKSTRTKQTTTKG